MLGVGVSVCLCVVCLCVCVGVIAGRCAVECGKALALYALLHWVEPVNQRARHYTGQEDTEH